MPCVGSHTVLFHFAYQLNEIFRLSNCSQEGIMDGKYSSTWKIKKGTKYMVFNILEICQGRTVFPRKQKTNKVSLVITSANCLDVVFRSLHKERELRWSLLDSLNEKDRAKNLGRQRQLKATGIMSKRRELNRKKTLTICRGFLLSNQVSHDKCTHWNYRRPG